MRELYWRDASGRLTFDLANVPYNDYPAVCQDLIGAFSLALEGSPVIGIDLVFCDFRQGERIVGFDWDHWMGFMVVAKNDAAEALVRSIGDWLLGSSRWAWASDHGRH